MADYLVIDADSHVEEPEEAWDYLSEKYQDRRPFPIAVPNRPILANLNAFWWVDGQIFPKISGTGHSVFGTPPISYHATHKKFSIGSQSLQDPAARLKDMDAAGVDIQVNFPRYFWKRLRTMSRSKRILCAAITPGSATSAMQPRSASSGAPSYRCATCQRRSKS